MSEPAGPTTAPVEAATSAARADARPDARRPRISVPAAVFAETRPPAFPLLDVRGAPVSVEPGWLGRHGGETVTISPEDLEALHQYLRKHLQRLVAQEDVWPADRAWAIHRTLLGVTADALRGDGAVASDLNTVCRALAAFVARRPGHFPFLGVISVTRFTPVTRAVETALYATALAAADGVREIDRLAALAIGGVLADVGKLGPGGETLDHHGPLEADEWRLMREHPRRSVEIMRRQGIVGAPALRGVLHHHERWDGEGYPDGLQGEAIPHEARCIAIADAYSAMTVDRPYRERRDPYGALAEMAQSRGQFDPRLLRLFVPLLCSAEDEQPEVDRALGGTSDGDVDSLDPDAPVRFGSAA